MTQQANFFKLGVFIIGSFFLCAGFLIALGAGKFFKKEVLAETYFNESVQGLNVGSPVKYKGVTIGSVKAIASAAGIYDETTDYIRVVMALSDDVFLGQTGKNTAQRVEKAIEKGLTIHLAFMGLTGAAYLETDYFEISRSADLDFKWDPEHIYIPSRQSNMKRLSETLNHIMDSLSTLNIQGMVTDLQQLMHTMNNKMNDIDLKEISLQTESLLKETRDSNQAIKEMFASDMLKQLISDARSSVSRLNTILEKAQVPVEQTLADFEQTARNTRQLTNSLEDKLTGEITAFSRDLSTLMASLERTAGMLGNTVWLNSEAVNTTIENLKTTSENLKHLSREIKTYPGRLLFESPPEPEKGNQ